MVEQLKKRSIVVKTPNVWPHFIGHVVHPHPYGTLTVIDSALHPANAGSLLSVFINTTCLLNQPPMTSSLAWV